MENPRNDPPWSIPIREAGPDIPQRSAKRPERLPVFPVAIGAVVLFVAVVAAVVMIGDEPSSPDPEVLGDRSSATTAAPVTTDGSVADTPPSTTTTTTSATTTTAAPSTTDATRVDQPALAGEPAGLPVRTADDLDDGWVAQVSSVPSSAGGNALVCAYETVTATVPDAAILRGSEWAPLREGFWVIVQPGFDSAEDAVGACDASGRTGRDQCFARYLSADDETQLTCWREESGALAGACS